MPTLPLRLVKIFALHMRWYSNSHLVRRKKSSGRYCTYTKLLLSNSPGPHPAVTSFHMTWVKKSNPRLCHLYHFRIASLDHTRDESADVDLVAIYRM